MTSPQIVFIIAAILIAIREILHARRIRSLEEEVLHEMEAANEAKREALRAASQQAKEEYENSKHHTDSDVIHK